MVNPLLNPGDAAPAFELEADDNRRVSSSELRGQRFVLYFYPKDDTPGCTTEACDFRDNLSALASLGVQVFGVSPDNVASHKRFKEKYDLTFPLLADEGHAVAERFGVWREKKNYGRTYMGIVRGTFVIDAEGRLEKVYDNVRAKGHVERVMRDLGD